jgi:hypothetical protein
MRWIFVSTAMAAATIVARAQAATAPLVDIKGDGNTCPEGTNPVEVQSGKCVSGEYISDRDASGKCCFQQDQSVFVQSLPGGEDHLNATYAFDSQACCNTDEKDTSLQEGVCSYDTQKLAVPTDLVSKCCWNPTAKEFTVHLIEFQPQLNLTDVNIKKDGQAPNSFCNLGYKITVKNVRLYGDRAELDIDVNADCGIYNHSAQTTLVVYLKAESTASGKLSYPISLFGTINVDLTSKINTDKSINVHGRVTGTGIFGRVEEGFDETVKDDSLAELLTGKTIC